MKTPHINKIFRYAFSVRTLEWDHGNPDPVVDEIISEFAMGKPVIIPTDTLYGLACPLSNKSGLKRIFDLKSRPEGITLPVAVGEVEDIHNVAIPDRSSIGILMERLPGPYSFILPANPSLPSSVTRNGSVAVRVPDHPLFPILCKKIGPMALTSANLHGRRSVSTIEEAMDQFGQVDLLMILDRSRVFDQHSTIIDLTGSEPMVVRDRRRFEAEHQRDQDG